MTDDDQPILATPEYVARRIRALLNVSTEEGFRLLEQGKLNGSLAEPEIKLLRFLTEGNK